MEENKQNKKIHPDTLKWVIMGLAGFVVIVLIFGAGIFVGEMKARFSYRWAENYHKNFGGPSSGFLGDWKMFPPDNEFIESYGTFGQILKIDSSTGSGQAATLVIKGRSDVEKIILIDDKTVIKSSRETLRSANLKVNDLIVVIGEPNDAGQIVAKLIRLLPAPPKRESFRPFPRPML